MSRHRNNIFDFNYTVGRKKIQAKMSLLGCNHRLRTAEKPIKKQERVTIRAKESRGNSYKLLQLFHYGKIILYISPENDRIKKQGAASCGQRPLPCVPPCRARPPGRAALPSPSGRVPRSGGRGRSFRLFRPSATVPEGEGIAPDGARHGREAVPYRVPPYSLPPLKSGEGDRKAVVGFSDAQEARKNPSVSLRSPAPLAGEPRTGVQRPAHNAPCLASRPVGLGLPDEPCSLKPKQEVQTLISHQCAHWCQLPPRGTPRLAVLRPVGLGLPDEPKPSPPGKAFIT